MIRKLSAFLAGALLCTLAFSQSVPNGTITQGQIWTVSQWNNAFQAKTDVSGGTLTGPTVAGGTFTGPTISNPTITGGTQSAPSITNATITTPSISGGTLSSPAITGTVTGSPTWSGLNTFSAGLNSASYATSGTSSQMFQQGNQSPSAGSLLQVDNAVEDASPPFPIDNEGSIWTSTAYAFSAVSHTVTNTTVPSQGSSGPLVGFFSFLNNNGATAPAVANISDCVARTASATCFAANFIARNASVNGTKLVGLEIDVEPAAGTTISSQSGGLFLNSFSSSVPVAVQVGALGGGSWLNGFVSADVTGAHFSVQSSSTIASYGLDLANTTYGTAGILMGVGVTNGICLGSAGFGTCPFVYGDSSNNMQIKLATGAVMSVSGPVQLPNYTVATLPACAAATAFSMAVVTDANSPTYNGALTGGGTTKIPVFCSGSAWSAH